jgi:hypothetical protein
VRIEFVVEEAGCPSCGELIREAMGELGRVAHVDMDERADVAVVGLEPTGPVSQDEVDRILGAVSAGAGHAYRVRPGSWHVIAA